MNNNIDANIDELFKPVSDVITSFVFSSFNFLVNLFHLLYVGCYLQVFFTFYFNFLNIRYFKRAINVAFGKYDDVSHPGEITHFQSFTAAMSGTIGLGNIAGVAVAISLGGPGAMVWMIITAFFGMTLKFVEVSLGHKYRIIHDDGTVSGGAMRYLSQGLSDYGFPKIWTIFSYFFCSVLYWWVIWRWKYVPSKSSIPASS